MTILAFDFGTKYIGVAVGNAFIKIAHTLNVIKNKRKNGKINWLMFNKLIDTWNPEKIIVGLPLNMDGSKQYITILTKKFASSLKHRYHICIELHDERLSTIEAKNILFSYGGWKNLQRNNINSMSASIILQSWFNNK
ncbi:Holliday junction resolvase RuvX [Enterobacteriaceae endosymbiont of Neohaemonia nigricornis]|uniref:Holliday junction resolvase RuvX n=1 Tax=Enterobacteriaceae endosymbiont of Neohaemonia nigricornis TaxID=2675792 RepID=UPI001449832D|nr:Holliday junction resolvase RuvX [Enterobacteriaceae endosymbiont of Neohaemonia nigricornis]QJC30472.1 Holliday junction resolvase RuvX [Enterobacteriaceae endosymbiont of Neohaemonia nigricornis]